MGEPNTRSKDKIRGAIQEIVSAMSALNMPPEKRKPTNTEAEFLSETDAWAHHAYQHLKAAFKYLTDFNAEQQLQEARHFRVPKESNYEDFLKVWKGMPEEVRQTVKEYGLNQHILNSFPNMTVAELIVAMKKLEDGSWSKPE